MSQSDSRREPRFTGSVEFTPGFRPRPEISYVLFDFDGTLSLIRQGWPEVMVPMFVEMLPPRPGESDADLHRLAYDDIMRLTGKQTIYQMIQLVERIRERGGQPREPLWYKHEYLRRLDQRIRSRIEALQSGQARPDDWLVYGSPSDRGAASRPRAHPLPRQRNRRAVRQGRGGPARYDAVTSATGSTGPSTITAIFPRRS